MVDQDGPGFEPPQEFMKFEKATDHDLVILDRLDGLMKKVRFREKIPVIGEALTTEFRLKAAALIPLLSDGGVHEFRERRRKRRNR